ncbi:hypothetical protein JTE90_002449 [Oedothorax gibbosus]|uniref:Uncharacterized protein n=1 Tax=Oedothorax gibbosus TaxID=931172 RepID=A0AAV6UW69_9ARAC|nr:hypothetical protein JTE90_002449 [Oedothorax gibbosus]
MTTIQNSKAALNLLSETNKSPTEPLNMNTNQHIKNTTPFLSLTAPSRKNATRGDDREIGTHGNAPRCSSAKATRRPDFRRPVITVKS